MRIFLLLLFVFSAALSAGDLVGFFKEAMGHAQCEDKHAYTDMGYSQSQFSKMMNGVEPPRFLGRLWMIQNAEVVKWFAFLIEEHTGPPALVERAMHVEAAHEAHRQMLKASVSSTRFVNQPSERAS